MSILDVVFPKRCVGCGRIGTYVCDRCRDTIRPVAANEAMCPMCERPAIDGVTHPRCRTRYSLDGLTSFFHYDGIIRKAVKAVKYRFVSDLSAEFVSLIPRFGFDEVPLPRNTNRSLIPIPLHASRLRERGFNQAEILGRLVAKELHVPTYTDILRRTKLTVPQVAMRDREERLGNMKDVFAVDSNTAVIRNVSVILFDDVFTTGATMRSAGNVLKRSGAQWVWAVTMAR